MKKVMAVDDSRFIVDDIRHALTGTGYELVETCRDAEEAMLAYARHRPDVVLMDIVLPGIDGMMAAGALLTKWPGANIVIMSSLAYEDTIDNARTIGAKSFLIKPFTPQQLLKVLDAVII